MPRKNDAPKASASIRDRVLEMRRVPASELLPNPRNWRIHNDAQRRIFREMLDRIGFAGAELVRTLPDGRLMLIDGHMRQEELGDTPLPVLVTDLTEQEADALLATFDPLGRLAGTDRDAASALIESLGAAGFDAAADLLRAVADNDQTAALLESLADSMLGGSDDDGEDTQRDVDDPGGGGDDFDTTPDESGPTRCQSGDLWQLGEHRLLCGDSTKREDVARLMDGERADMMWTDPPYGVSYVGKTKRSLTIQNDGSDGLAALLHGAFACADDALTAGAAVYIAHPAGARSVTFANAFVNQGWRLHETLVWVKDSMVLGHSDYHYKHEPILYGYTECQGRRGRGGDGWYGDHSQTSVFEVPRPKRSEEHPTMKPLALIAPMMANSSPDDGTVYEPFCGSGSTLIVAERLGRACYALELDPRYCDVILRRWEAETGREATLLSRVSEPQSEPAEAAAR